MQILKHVVELRHVSISWNYRKNLMQNGRMGPGHLKLLPWLEELCRKLKDSQVYTYNYWYTRQVNVDHGKIVIKMDK